MLSESAKIELLNNEPGRGMIWFTSDLHLCHDRDFLYAPRGFVNVEEMNDAIVANWNKTVQEEDDVYLLGDVMLNENEQGIELLQYLNGKIHVILGNHDTDNRVEAYRKCRNVVSIEYATIIKFNGYRFYLSHYPTITMDPNRKKPLKNTLINLYGHTHQLTNFYTIPYTEEICPIMYHVGVDSHNCTPVSVEQILAEIREMRNKKYSKQGNQDQKIRLTENAEERE